MSKEKELITFIIPVYKTPKDMLLQCIESVRRQTYKNIEIILVDDGSPDDCPKICDMFAKEDNRIRVIHQKNGGLANARVTGLKNAKGVWICFVDSDDWVEIDLAKKALNEASIFYQTYKVIPSVVIWNYFKEYGKISKPICSFESVQKNFITEDDIKKVRLLPLNLISNVCQAWTKMYNRDFLIQNELFSNENLTQGEDVEYNLRVFQKVTSVLFIPDILHHYRYDENTMSTTFNENYPSDVLRFIIALYDDVMNIDNNEDLVKKFYERCCHTLLALSVRFTFHKKNPHPFKKKVSSFRNFCSQPTIEEAIRKATYKNFSLARKLAVFFLKHNIILGLYVIAKFRQFQYSIKQ